MPTALSATAAATTKGTQNVFPTHPTPFRTRERPRKTGRECAKSRRTSTRDIISPRSVDPTHGKQKDHDREKESVVTVNDTATGSLIEARVCDKPSRIFLDTGAMINIISVDYLRKIKPGVIVLEPTHYSLY